MRGPRRAKSQRRRPTLPRTPPRTTTAATTTTGQQGLPGLVDPVAETLAALRRKGFGRLYVDGQTLSLEEVDPAVLQDRPMLQVIVDRREGRRRPARRGSPTRSRRPTPRAAAPAFAIELADCRSRRPPLQRALRVPQLRHSVRGAAAAAVLVQQSVRRVRRLPRVRQHHRARHEPGRAGPVEVDPPERDRAVEQAALSRPARRAEARGEGRQPAPRRALVAADRRGAPVRRRGRRRGVRGRERLLPLARAEEVQGARPRVPEPLPRLPDVPGLSGRAAAARGARREGRRADDRSGVRAHGARRRPILLPG